MPLVRYEIRSEHSLANPDLYRATKDEPEGLLEGVATAGLVGIVRQIGDLAEFAADIFRDLHEEVMAVSAKGHDLAIRVQQIEAEMPSIEKALLSETNQLKYAYNAGTEWHASIRTDQNHCTQGDLPRFIRNSYEECRGPPRLFLLDKFDVAGAGACLKRYTDPSYFKTEWATSELMKAEREQKARKKKKGRRRKDNPNSVDTMPVTQINSRVRYSSRGVETDGPPGPSASLNSEYLAKQSREAQPPSRGPDASSVSGSSVSSVALSETQTRVAPPARRGAESGSKTEYLKQPRLGLPPGRIMEIGGGKGSSKVEQQGQTSKEVLPVTRGVGTDAPAKRQISTIPEQLALQMRETIAGGAGDNSLVTSAKLPPSRHTRQPSGSDTLSSLGLGSALQVDEPLKLNAKEIEAETLSGRFVRVHPKLDLVSETNEANSKGQVSRFNQVDDKAQLIPPLDRPSGHEQVQPPTSDEQELLVKPPSNRFESQALEQIPPADGADDLAGDADHFLDALATMESDGETDAEPRTSGAQLPLDAQATSAPSSQDTVDHKTLTNEEDSKTHVDDSPKGIAALDIEASADSPADSLASPRPTTFNEALPSPSLTVHSSELMSPSSVGTYSVDEDEDPVLTPTGQGLARVAEELPSSSEAALPGEVQSGSEPLISSETAQGPPSSSSQFAMPSRQPPSPPRLSKPVISPREVVGPPRDATGSIFNKFHLPAIDPPSPSGTVVVLPSPVNALGSPWDLVSPAGSTSDVSSPRRFGGSARDVLSPTASNASEADLAPKLKSLGVTANAFPAEDLPTDLKPPGNELLSPSGIDPLSSPSTTLSEEAAEVVTVSPGVDSFPQTSLPDEYDDMPASVNKDQGGSGDLKEAVGTDVAELEVKGGEAEKPEQLSEGDQPAEKVLSKDFEGHQDQHITKGISDKAEELTAGVAEQVTHEEELAAVDPLLHLLSSEDEVDEELDEELAEAARSSRVSPPRAPPPRAPSPPAPPSPPSSQSPKAHRFSVLDPLSLSDTEANDPELSPGGSDGTSPKSSIFSALHSPMSPPLHGRKLLDSPGSRSARSFRASEVLDPTSPTHSPRPELQRSPTAKSLPEIMPPVPPLHPGQWHERKPSIPLEFGRSPSRIPPPPPPIPSTRTKQPSPPPAPMPTRRAPIAGEQDALMDAIAAHDRSQLRKVSLSLQASPSRSSPTQDREGLLQQIRSQSFSLRETKSSPRVQPETLQRPVTNINVAAILEKANAIRQAFTGSDDEDDEDDRWSDTT